MRPSRPTQISSPRATAPTLTKTESGHVVVHWPDPPQQSYEVAHEVVQEFVDTHNRLVNLERWKAEALPLLSTLDRCHDLLPPDAQAPLGHSKADAIENFLARALRQGSEG